MNRPPVDLTNRDREPIHIPGSIQPHGFLAACSADELTIVHVSENVERFVSAPPAQVLGTRLSDWLTAESAALLLDAQAAEFPRDRNPLPIVMRTGRAHDAIAHRSPTAGLTIVEFEPTRGLGKGFDVRMRGSVRRLQDVMSRGTSIDTAVRELRTLS